MAWERPDKFSKVLSHIGSFTNIRGGHNYPALIRKTEKKPIRVLVQDGSGDLDNLHGNWPLANQEMASALAFAGYDFRCVFGDGAHNGKHGGAILPESLRWLWRPELEGLPAPQTKDNLEQRVSDLEDRLENIEAVFSSLCVSPNSSLWRRLKNWGLPPCQKKP